MRSFGGDFAKIGYNLYNVKKAVYSIGVIVLLIILGGLIYLSLPRIVEVTPADSAANVAGSTSIRVRFSRQMDAASVTSRLDISPLQTGQISWENNTLIFTPLRPWPSGTLVQVRLASGARAFHFPQFTLLHDKQWSFTIGSPKLLYLYPIEGPASLYVLDLLTGKKQNITRTLGEVLDFSVSPNGATIVIAIRTEKGSAIYLIPGIDGKPSLLRTFENGQVTSPILSPSQNYLAYALTDLNKPQPDTHIWLLNVKDGFNVAPVQLPDSGGPVQYPLWSSGDILAYYDRASQTYRFYDPQTKTEIAKVACQTGEKGSWSTDGQSFVFAEILMPTDNAIPTSHLLRYTLNSHKIVDLSQANNTEDASPQYSPDGKYLVFGRKFLDPLQWTPGRQIWIMDVTTLKSKPLLQEAQFNHYDFAWSPAGDQLAYMRFNQGNPISTPEIWVIQSDGNQDRQWISGGYSPQWIP